MTSMTGKDSLFLFRVLSYRLGPRAPGTPDLDPGPTSKTFPFKVNVIEQKTTLMQAFKHLFA